MCTVLLPELWLSVSASAILKRSYAEGVASFSRGSVESSVCAFTMWYLVKVYQKTLRHFGVLDCVGDGLL